MMGDQTNAGGTDSSAVVRGGASGAAATSQAQIALAKITAATPRPRKVWDANGPGNMTRTSGV